MEWCAPEVEDVLLLVAGRQGTKECIYRPPVVIHSMALEATTLLCEQAGMERGTAREEADRRYGIEMLV